MPLDKFRKNYLFIYTVLICNNIANYLVSMGVTDLYLSAGLEEPRLILGIVPWTAEIAATLTLMFPLFLFAELGPIDDFDSWRQVLKFAGMNIRQRQSGRFVGQNRITHKGRPHRSRASGPLARY